MISWSVTLNPSLRRSWPRATVRVGIAACAPSLAPHLGDQPARARMQKRMSPPSKLRCALCFRRSLLDFPSRAAAGPEHPLAYSLGNDRYERAIDLPECGLQPGDVDENDDRVVDPDRVGVRQSCREHAKLFEGVRGSMARSTGERRRKQPGGLPLLHRRGRLSGLLLGPDSHAHRAKEFAARPLGPLRDPADGHLRRDGERRNHGGHVPRRNRRRIVQTGKAARLGRPAQCSLNSRAGQITHLRGAVHSLAALSLGSRQLGGPEEKQRQPQHHQDLSGSKSHSSSIPVPVGLGRPRDYSQEEFPDAAAVGVEVNALPLLSSFLLILLAELPDKTLYTVLLLATRNRPWPVLFGAW